jgi:hypothetical protein
LHLRKVVTKLEIAIKYTEELPGGGYDGEQVAIE